MLDARAVHPARSDYHHLLAIAQTHGFPNKLVDLVLELVGLAAVASMAGGGLSLGMSQRLGVATALLGDPEVLVLDEPVNGLGPDGVIWIRDTLSALAREGRTVFLSSRLMSELSLIAEDLVVIGQGELLASGSVEDIVSSVAPSTAHVVSSDAAAIQRTGVSVTSTDWENLVVQGRSVREVGTIAPAEGITLFELTTRRLSLEGAFMQITRSTVEYGIHRREVGAA